MSKPRMPRAGSGRIDRVSERARRSDNDQPHHCRTPSPDLHPRRPPHGPRLIQKIVGVNVHTDSITSDLEILRISHEVEVEQVRTLSARRTSRDEAAVTAALQHMVEVGRTDANMIEPILEACRAEATLGEICDALRAEWGEYREPARF